MNDKNPQSLRDITELSQMLQKIGIKFNGDIKILEQLMPEDELKELWDKFIHDTDLLYENMVRHYKTINCEKEDIFEEEDKPEKTESNDM